MDYSKRFKCRRRGELGGMTFPGMPEDDHWRELPDGTHTCSYCGSMSEENFLDIVQHYVDGDPGYKFEPSTKNYKYYANRPLVSNASEGAIKFYTAHVETKIDDPDVDEKEALVNKALVKSQEALQKLFGPAPDAKTH